MAVSKSDKSDTLDNSAEPAAPAKPARTAGALPALAIAALALASCISDGPNSTGGQYLSDNGILLATPLYHVTLPYFPVDSVWGGDLDPDRFGDTVMLAGHWNGFSAEARMAYDLADTAFLDSLGTDTTDGVATLNLSLGCPKPYYSRDPLLETAKGADSMRFVVETWSIRDSAWTASMRADSLYTYNHRFLVRQDTSAFLPADDRVADTVTLSVDSAYGRDSLQNRSLPNLRKRLQAHPESKWIVLVRLSSIPLSDSGADSSGAILRFGGNFGTVYSPMLIFGNTHDAVNANNTRQKVFPLVVTESNRRGVNSRLRYQGPSENLLTGKTRGLHLRLDRAALLDSLDAALRRQSGGVSGLKRAPSGEDLDLSYFVPFAEISVPVDSSRTDAGLPLELRLLSELDSLIPGGPVYPGADTVPLGSSLDLVVQRDPNETDRITDTLFARYEKAPRDSSLRMLVLGSRKDSVIRDTSYYTPGEARELVWGVRGFGRNLLAIQVDAGSTQASLDLHLNARAAVENNDFRDPTTGIPLKTVMEKIPRYLKAGQTSLDLRSTRGFQRLMNRARMGQDFFPDFFVQPLNSAAIDTTAKAAAPYPVFGEVFPGIRSGRLGVGINIYLFPLKDR